MQQVRSWAAAVEQLTLPYALCPPWYILEEFYFRQH